MAFWSVSAMRRRHHAFHRRRLIPPLRRELAPLPSPAHGKLRFDYEFTDVVEIYFGTNRISIRVRGAPSFRRRSPNGASNPQRADDLRPCARHHRTSRVLGRSAHRDAHRREQNIHRLCLHLSPHQALQGECASSASLIAPVSRKARNEVDQFFPPDDDRKIQQRYDVQRLTLNKLKTSARQDLHGRSVAPA